MYTFFAILLSVVMTLSGSPADQVNTTLCSIDNVDTVLPLGQDVFVVHFNFDNNLTHVIAHQCHGWEVSPNGITFVEF